MWYSSVCKARFLSLPQQPKVIPCKVALAITNFRLSVANLKWPAFLINNLITRSSRSTLSTACALLKIEWFYIRSDGRTTKKSTEVTPKKPIKTTEPVTQKDPEDNNDKIQMPLNSCSDLVLDERSPSCSSQSSATETYTVPLGTSTEIDFKYDDEQVANILDRIPIAKPTGGNVTTVIGDNNTVGAKVNIGVDAETTTININHYHPKPDPDAEDDNEPKNNDYHHQKSTSDKKSSATTLRYIFIPSAVLFLIFLVIISIIAFQTGIFDTPAIFPPTNPNTSTYIDGHPVYSRVNWGALEPKSAPPFIPLPTSVIIISHSATKSCSNFTQCSNETQCIQYKFLQQGHRDIGFNFLIGGEGGIYDGRGWDVQNSIRAESINIAFIGDFNNELSTTVSEKAALALINEGVRLGKVDGDYKLVGENQTSPKRFYSPGWNLVKVIKKWEHYYNGTML